MHSLLSNVRHALRVLWKTPGVTIVAVLSLALGIGANTAIFTIINSVFLNPLPVKEPSSLAEVFTVDTQTATTTNFTLTPSSLPNYQDYREQNTVFSGLAASTFPIPLNWSGPAEPEQLPCMLVSANYFDLLGVPAYLGRTFLPDEDKKPGGNPVAVLSYSLWTKRFGADRGVIGRVITLNQQPYTVVGVAPRNFKGTFSLANPDAIWIPLSMRSQALSGFLLNYAEDRRFRWLFMIGRLKDGVGIRQAEANLKTIASALAAQYPNDNKGRTVSVASLSDSALGINQRRQFVLAGSVLMGVVGLVLLIACVNVANLLLSQAAKREKEFTIRAAMGANRAQLLRQLLTESSLLSLLGAAVGLVIAYWGRSALWSFRPPFLEANAIGLALDARVLGFTAAVAVLTGLLFGIVPALKASNPNLAEILKTGGRGNTMGWTHNRLRSLLVVAEMALALVALVGAGLFVRSMQNAQKMELGFESKNLFVFGFNLASQRYETERGLQFFRDAVERARSVPGVEAAAIATNAPLAGGIFGTVAREGEENNPNLRGTLVAFNEVSPDYFETLRIPRIRGRNFTEFDRDGSTPVAIVGQAMAKMLWPDQDAVGKRFFLVGLGGLYEVVGIVADSVQLAVGETPAPVAYFPVPQRYTPAVTLQVRTSGNPDALVGSVRAQVQQLDRNLPLTNVQTIEQILDQGLWAPRMGAALLGLFGLLALLLASVGIYGVLAYSVSQRTHEIGIRMALGAHPGQVLHLVLKEGMRLAAAGAGLGIVAAIFLMRLASDLLYEVSARDPLTYGSVALLLCAVAFLACYVPARRATGVDPLVALRYE